MSTVALFLQCPCTPGKQYASTATLRAHQRTQRHRLYALETELRDVRAELAASEQARLELERTVRDLATQPRQRRVTERTKKRVAASQGWRCTICTEVLSSAFQVDHIVPLWRGGGNEEANLRALCANCHALKTQEEALR